LAKGWVIVGLILIGIVITVVYVGSYALGPGYQYNKKIRSLLANAYDASTFEQMKEWYLKAKQAMIDEGLENDMYGSYFYWDQTPDMQMAYTYQYIDGLVARCDMYIAQIENLSVAPLSDVYNQMITNMREESQRHGPVDWTAGPAWILKNAAIYYFMTPILIVLWIVVMIASIVLGIIWYG